MKDVVGTSGSLTCDIDIPLYKEMETLEMLFGASNPKRQVRTFPD